jgi:hypothetical protein
MFAFVAWGLISYPKKKKKCPGQCQEAFPKEGKEDNE